MAFFKRNKKATEGLKLRVIRDSAIWSYLPAASKAVADGPRGLLVYDDMKKDPRIASLFGERVAATHNKPCHLSASQDQGIRDYCAKYLTEKKIRLWAYKLLRGALTYGFQPAEIIWGRDEAGFWFVDALATHRIDRYRFDSDGGLWYDLRKLDQPYKWIVHRVDGDSDDNPYGTPYLDCVYWPWMFKRLGMEYWLKAEEMFSCPSIVAIFDQSDTEKARKTADELASLVGSITAGSGGALANIKDLKQIDMGGSVSDFDVLVTAMDLQICYGMTGQALANSISATGTQALGTVQERTKGSLWENDARALSYTVQKLVDMAIGLNFGAAALAPEFEFETRVRADFQQVMQAYGAGIPISRSAMYGQYGLPEPEGEDDALERQEAPVWPGGAFNFSDAPSADVKKKRPLMLIRRSKGR